MVEKISLIFVIEDARWKRIAGLRARLAKAAAATHAFLPKKLRFPASATVLLGHNAGVRKLNRAFRGFDKPTNVLSFPQFEAAGLAKQGKKGGGIELGDIALAYQYIVSEAEKGHKILINHVTHLVIHGLLHLFGYDHGQDGEAARMEGLEKKIMRRLGLPDPYKPMPASNGKSRKKGRAKTKRP